MSSALVHKLFILLGELVHKLFPTIHKLFPTVHKLFVLLGELVHKLFPTIHKLFPTVHKLFVLLGELVVHQTSVIKTEGRARSQWTGILQWTDRVGVGEGVKYIGCGADLAFRIMSLVRVNWERDSQKTVIWGVSNDKSLVRVKWERDSQKTVIWGVSNDQSCESQLGKRLSEDCDLGRVG